MTGQTSTTTGVLLFRDTTVNGAFDLTDSVIELQEGIDWSSMSLTLTPSTTVSLSAGSTQYFFVGFKTSGTGANGDQIVATIPQNGIVTSQGSGPSVAFPSNAYAIDTQPPSILSYEGVVGSPTTTVRFSEPVQSIDLAPLDATAFTFLHGGEAQTVANVIHSIGQDFATIVLSGNASTTDLDGTLARVVGETSRIADLAGNLMPQTTSTFASPLRVITPSIPTVISGTTYSSGSPLVTLSGAGGTAPYTFEFENATASSTLAGRGIVLLSSGKVIGTATTTGSFAFPVRIIDASTASSVRMYTLNVGSLGGSVPGITNVVPAGGPQSGTVSVTVTGANTSFSGSSLVEFLMPVGVGGTNDVTASAISASNATTLSFTANIGASASTGSRDLRITTGGQVITYPNAFSVFADSGSGLQLLLPTANATGVPVPSVFSFSQTTNNAA